jgi:hypothetical protein
MPQVRELSKVPQPDMGGTLLGECCEEEGEGDAGLLCCACVSV